MSLKVLHLTRKTTSETNKVVLRADLIAYVSETKDSTSIHLTSQQQVIVVIEPYDVVLRMWATSLLSD